MWRYFSSLTLSLTLLFSLSFCLLTLRVYGQEKVTLAGKVTDERTGLPLPFSNVFINNTTIGTTADENGNYKLAGLDAGTLDMVVSFLGYETVRQTLRFEKGGLKTVHFKLKEGVQLEGFVVRGGKSKKREKQLQVIQRELLGKTSFSKLCKLVNPEVLRISEEDGHLMAQTIQPLIIENQALGYRIFQDLDDFDYHQNKLHYGGSTRFEYLIPKDDQQKVLWEKNRKIAYTGSIKHLFASMVADSLAEEGFKVFQEIPPSLRMFNSVRPVNGQNVMANHIRSRVLPVRGEKLVTPGELPTERLVSSATQLEVFYVKKRGRSPYADMPYAYTQMTLPAGYIVITTTGWVAMPMGYEIAGYHGNDRFSTLLPADWTFKKD